MTNTCFENNDFEKKCFDPENGQSVQKSLITVVHKYSSVLFRQLSEYEVYPGQVPMIMIVEMFDGLSQSEIAKKLHIKASTVAVSIKRMEKKGLLQRKPDIKDQRVIRVYATQQLHDLHEKINELVKLNERKIMEGFTEEETEIFRGYLVRLSENLDSIETSGFENTAGKRVRNKEC